MVKEYNKLVRNCIPKIIAEKGESAVVHVASDEEYKEKLKEKLLEEVNEYVQSGDAEELADLLEVFYAICDNSDFSVEDIEKIRADKAEKRGGFSERIILDRTE